MIARPRNRLDGIEACRGVAASGVVLYHAARHLDKNISVPDITSMLQFGHSGVDLFFVISGFIIFFIHYDDIGQPRRLARYAERRLTRVMPSYWVALALTIAIAAGSSHALPSPANLLTSILLIPSHHDPVLGIAWTLMHEVAFYAVFAILIGNRRLGVAVFGLWLAWIVLATVLHSDAGLPPSLSSSYNIEFYFGMAAALWLKARTAPVSGWNFVAGVALFAAVALSENAGLLDGNGDLARVAYGIPAALVVVGAAAASQRGSLAVPGVLRRLGSASYSIYLFQFVFTGLVWKLLSSIGLNIYLPHVVVFCALAASGVFGGILMSRLVEYPIMNLVRRARTPALVLR